MRASMTENRLTGLALMHIHYAKTVDLDKVIEEFANKHPRKMKLQSIIYEIGKTRVKIQSPRLHFPVSFLCKNCSKFTKIIHKSCTLKQHD
jgi:hypothetical protein